MNALRAFFGSMTGRLFVILAVGMAAAALLAAVVTSRINDRSFQRQLLERTADQLESTVVLLDALPAAMRWQVLAAQRMGGIRAQPRQAKGFARDTVFENVLVERGGMVANATVQQAGFEVCYPELRAFSGPQMQRFWESEAFRRAVEQSSARRLARPREQRSTIEIIPPTCRLISVPFSDGSMLNVSLETRWVERERSRLLEPAYLALLAVAIGILAYFVARIATAPLKRLSNAAAELGQNLDRPPINLAGPTEVRRAARAFNSMQRQLQQHVSERMRMLAAITHDLQTPLTRLRLRMERIEDESLRERLVADLRAMKALIDEGLELARSTDTAEPAVMLDLDSLLESLVEDAADAGAQAVFEGRSQAVLRLQPLAARRLFSNLIDNAIKYGGSATVSAQRSNGSITVRIRDRGPGLPEDMLERIFEPFARMDSSRSRETGGVGLGLTIARMLAEKNGARVTLRNHPEGGLEAIVRWDKVSVNVAPSS